MKGFLLSLILLCSSSLYSMELASTGDSIIVKDSVKVHTVKKAVLFSPHNGLYIKITIAHWFFAPKITRKVLKKKSF